MEEIEAAMKGMLAPKFKEVELGRVEVRKVYKISNVGIVAGCYVTEGRVTRNAQLRLVRDGIVIHEGVLSSLQRFKDAVKEVAQGYECGIGIEKYSDIKVGDIIEAFLMSRSKCNRLPAAARSGRLPGRGYPGKEGRYGLQSNWSDQ